MYGALSDQGTVFFVFCSKSVFWRVILDFLTVLMYSRVMWKRVPVRCVSQGCLWRQWSAEEGRRNNVRDGQDCIGCNGGR